jgi:lipid-A-disaccharide synthase
MTYDVLAHSRAAIVCSGTVTVEAMILGCPMVIMYRGSRVMVAEYKLLGKRIKFIGMPNIIMDRMICPEFVANDATPRRISESALKLIQDSPERTQVLRDLAEARAVLGEPGAVKKTANVVAEMLKTS